MCCPVVGKAERPGLGEEAFLKQLPNEPDSMLLGETPSLVDWP